MTRFHHSMLSALIWMIAGAAAAATLPLDQYQGYLDLHDEDRVTGRFTIGEDDEGHTWFWTPEGNAYFGMGVNKVSSIWVELHNGDAWRETYGRNRWTWGEMQRERLLDWSFNSIAHLSSSGPRNDNYTYGDSRLYRRMQLPFAVTLFLVAHEGIRNCIPEEDYLSVRFPDVWSDDWAETADLRAERMISKVRTDPHLLGYYMANELWTRYEYEGHEIWADYIIALDSDAPGKQQWVAMMAEVYSDPEEFNAVYADSLGWSISYFGELHEVYELRMEVDDAREFTYRILDRFGQVAHSKVKKYDPDHLILGTRMSLSQGAFGAAVEALAPYCDVLSFNSYGSSPRLMDTVHQYTDKPIIISETSYLADDTGYSNRPYPRVPDQEQRGVSYRWAITEFASRPFVVGVWWHAFYDHGADENWRNWGLIDPLNDTPYDGLLDLAQETNEMLFDIHSGEVTRSWWRSSLEKGQMSPGD